jgi:RNA polymerase sigma-70 factor (ECF subfamily)
MAMGDGPDAPTDEALMARVQDGDAVAFGLLARRYERPLFNYMRRMIGSASDAEDLFQETFLRVHRHADRFRAGAPFKPWVYRIATNLCKDHLKYMSRRRHRSLDAPVSDENATSFGDTMASADARPDEEARGDELEERLAVAVKALPDKQRAVFLMARYDGMPYQDIATALGIPVGTVKSRMNKATNTLLEQLKEFRT